jgi:hypothetical protein
MGMKTRSTFEEALQDARKYVGDHPNILPGVAENY